MIAPAFWAYSAAVLSLILTIKLMFFTEHERVASRLFYRLTLFGFAFWSATVLIDVLYLREAIGPGKVVFLAGCLYGSFKLKAHHLPWNQKR